ncbi:MAG: hypothetical protein FWF27_01260 [Candidatus Bathyarchaeota archaeon]|nr:hypothetical protein [Candidatus Termiticorpusculum sp.]
MSNGEDLFNKFPAEIRGAEIGMCYDPILRRLLNRKVFDSNRLIKDAIKSTPGTSIFQFRANSSVSKNIKDSLYTADAKAKIASYVTIGFNLEKDSNSVYGQDTLNCYGTHIYSGKELELLHLKPETLFKCMTDDFQKDLNELLDSKDTQSFLKNYLLFIQTWGYGCVTKLYLTACSAFEITATHREAQSAQRLKYCGSVGVNTPWGGGDVAVGYASHVKEVDGNAAVAITGGSLPQNAPTANWCYNLLTALGGVALSKLADGTVSIPSYTGGDPKEPVCPSGVLGGLDMSKNVPPSITEELRQKIMEADGFKDISWDKYMEAQEAVYATLSPEVIMEELKHLSDISIADYIEPECTAETVPRNDGGGVSVSSWDLGGYVPCAYEITSWSDLFPQLKAVKFPTTFTTLYLAKAFMFYLTRLQFASYLHFLAEVGPTLSKNPEIISDANRYHNKCDELFKEITTVLEKNMRFSKEDYDGKADEKKGKEAGIVRKFEKWINELPNFKSLSVYKKYCTDYRFFIENGLGFMQLWQYESAPGVWYTSIGGVGYSKVPADWTVLTMLTNKVKKVYPVVCPDGGIDTCVFSEYYGRWFRSDDAYFRKSVLPEKKVDTRGSYYEAGSCHLTIEARLYCFDFTKLDQLKGSSIWGASCIQTFDFEEIQKFAKPNRG